MIVMSDADALAAELVSIAVFVPQFTQLRFDRLSAAGRIDALRAGESLGRFAEAFQVRALAALDQAAQAERGTETGMTESEVMAAIRWPVGTVKSRLAEAGELSRRLPETLAALEQARVSWPQAKALANLTNCMSDEHARAVQDKTLPKMPTQGYISTRRAINRTILAVDPDGAAQRHAEQKTRRRVELRAEDHGMATLSLYTSAEIARGILSTLDAKCRTKAKGDTRTLDQRRADTLATMGLTGKLGWSQGSSVPATVHVLVGVETLMGLSDAPGEIEGYGVISAVQARALAAGARSVWRRLLIDNRGRLVHADARKYRPTAEERRQVIHRDRECDFPACHMPSRLCDLDHETPFAKGGPTRRQNLCPRCRRHHYLKTCRHWDTDHQDTTALWTSTKTGRTYTSTPEPYPVATDEDLLDPPAQ
jgi:hypothetical protein